MKLLAHLVRADVRRHRLLLLAWLVVVVVSAALDGLLPALDLDSATRRSLGPLIGLWSLTETLLFVLVIAMVIQTHPTVGSNAFWMTRPIPPGTLLASKAVLLGLAAIALPAVAQAVVMTFYRVPVGDLTAATTQGVLFACWWLVLLAMFAALTPTLARFALALGGALLAAAITLSIAAAVVISTVTGDFRPQRTPVIEDPTPDLAMLVLMTLGGAVALLVQYRHRSRARSVALAAAAVAVAIVAGTCWPWPFLAPRLTVPAWAADERPALVVLPSSIEALRIRTEGRRGRFWRSIRGRVYLEGLPPDTSAFVSLLEGTLRIDDRPALVSSVAGQFTVSADEGEEPPEMRAARSVLGVERLIHGGPPRGESPVIMTVPDDAFHELAPAVGVYRGRFEVVPTAHAVEAVLPLRVGATHQNGPYRVIIESLEPAPGAVSIEARQSNTNTALDRALPVRRSFYLRNRERSEAVASSFDIYQDASLGLLPIGIGRSYVSGFSAERLIVKFPPRYVVDDGEFALDEAWLAGAELVIVAATRQRAFERTLEVERFPLRLEAATDANP